MAAVWFVGGFRTERSAWLRELAAELGRAQEEVWCREGAMAAYERRQAEGRARVAELERELALARDEARRHYREWWQAREDRDHAHHLIRRLHRRIARLRGRPRRVG